VRSLPSEKLFGIPAPEKACDDENCPYHGSLTIRGTVFEGRVESNRMNRTAVVVREISKRVPKYERYERMSARIHVHVPPCVQIKEGDEVVVGECRPISKTVSFVVLGVKPHG